jgi:hypothetical protein
MTKIQLAGNVRSTIQSSFPAGASSSRSRTPAITSPSFPKAEHSAPQWQDAMRALMLVANRGGPTMLARIGVMRALHRNEERVFNPDRKDHHWGKRKLKRDK